MCLGATKDGKKVAQVMAQRARAKGALTPKPCAKCGDVGPVDMHHDDYSRPLDVTWLCRGCHRMYHRALAASGNQKGFIPAWIEDASTGTSKDREVGPVVRTNITLSPGNDALLDDLCAKLGLRPSAVIAQALRLLKRQEAGAEGRVL